MDTNANNISSNICLGHFPSDHSVRISDSITKFIKQSDKFVDFIYIKSTLSFSVNEINYVFIPITFNNEFNVDKIISTISTNKTNYDVVVCIINWSKKEVPSDIKVLLSKLSNAGANFILGYNSTNVSPYIMLESTTSEAVHCLPSIGSFLYLEKKIHFFVNLIASKANNKVYTQFSLFPISSSASGTFATLDTIGEKSKLYDNILSVFPKRLLSLTNSRKILLHGSKLLEEIAKKTAIDYDHIGINVDPLGLSFVGESDSANTNVDPSQYDIYFFDLARMISIKKWQDILKKYVSNLKQTFTSDQLVLLRIKLPALTTKQNQMRFHGESPISNARLEEMENYVIKELNPIVINISDFYLRDQLGGFKIAFESYFYDHCAKILQNIVSSVSSQKEYCEKDLAIYYDRIIKYYDSMIACSYQNYLFDDSNDASDLLAKNTSAEFIKQYKDNLIYLKLLSAKLKDVPNLIEDNESNKDFIRAAHAVRLILNKNINEQEESYSIIFKYKFTIIKTYTSLLAKQLNQKVSVKNAETITKIKDDPIKVKEYFRKHPLTKVDIWGSTNSKMTVEIASDILHINNYIMGQSQPLYDQSAISSIELPEEVEAYSNNSYRKRKIQGAILRDGKTVISKSSSSWIIVDFYNLICDYCKIDNELLEIDDFIIKTPFYKTIAKIAQKTYLFNEMSNEDIQNCVASFASFISDRYGENIILISTDLKDNYLDLDGSIKKFVDSDNTFAKKKKLLSDVEKAFAKVTSCYIIDISKKYQASDKYPLGGADYAHYEEGFYKEACSKIISIIQKTS